MNSIAISTPPGEADVRRNREASEIGIRASEIKTEPTEWLWRGRIAVGKISMMDGDPDVGKSTLTCEIAAALTTRSHFPDGFRYGHAVGVVFINAEDNAADTIVPRLRAAGADLDRCAIVRDSVTVQLPTGLERLDSLIDSVGAMLVVVDPLMAFIPTERNSWSDQHMRAVLAPLAAWADRVHTGVLLVRHLNKRHDTKALHRGGGSIGLIGAARFGLFVGEHPQNPDLRVLASSKCNIGRKPPSLAFQICESEENPEVGVVQWKGSIAMTADELVGYKTGSRYREIDVAKSFLGKTLEDGSVPATEIAVLAKAAGISERTLNRAKSDLNVESVKGKVGWSWKLPTEPDYSTNGVATDVPF